MTGNNGSHSLLIAPISATSSLSWYIPAMLVNVEGVINISGVSDWARPLPSSEEPGGGI